MLAKLCFFKEVPSGRTTPDFFQVTQKAFCSYCRQSVSFHAGDGSGSKYKSWTFKSWRRRDGIVESFEAFACAFEELSQPIGLQMLRRCTLRR